MNVIKRDGREVEFDKTKIVNAIKKAFASVGKNGSGIPEFIANEIEREYANAMVSVEDIQDKVEYMLMGYPRERDVAKAYINYRYLHGMVRDRYSEFMTAVSIKLGGKHVQNQNANVDEKSFGGRMGEATRILTKTYALNYILSPMARQNHISNRIYIHDLDNYAIGNHNCLSIPFDDLLKNGFNTRQTDVRPAKSVSTAMQLVAVISQIQSLQQFGGVSATHLDWTMAPYVRMSFFKHYIDGIKYIYPDVYETKNESWWKGQFNPEISIDETFYHLYEKAYDYAMDMTTRETYQACEGLFHNLNTLQSRSGNQLN